MGGYNPLTTTEHEDLREAVRAFAEEQIRPHARQWDQDSHHPTHLVKLAAPLGLVGPMISEAYGGAGADLLSAAIINEELTAVGGSVGICITGSALGTEMIEMFGTEDQKRLVLPTVAAGDAITGIAITEPHAGSDVASLDSFAERTPDGYRINGSKIFISNGTVAKYVLVLAKTTREGGHGDISCFLVPTDTPGYQARKVHTMGWRANDTAEIVLADVQVPADALVGEEGRGFYQVMHFFDRARVLAAANALGFAQGAMELALTYTLHREQFGRPLVDFQAVRFHIANMETKVASARLLVYAAAHAYQRGEKTTKAAAMAKLAASEIAEEVASISLQLHGGYGYSTEFEIERFYRDAKVMQIVEGTSEIQRVIISRETLAHQAQFA